MGKAKRLEWIERCEISAIWKKSDVDGYLLELMGDKYLEWLSKAENDDFWQMLVTRKRKQFETDRFMQDMGCFMSKHVVCLDADDKESYRLLLALLPENVMKQETVRGGHVFVKDSKGLLSEISKLGNVDVIQGNKGVKVYDKAGKYGKLEGEIIPMDAELKANLLMYLGEVSISAAKVINFTPQEILQSEFFESKGNGSISDCALNVLNFIRGKEQVKFTIPQGTRNNTLFAILSSIRGMGYSKEVIIKSAEVLENYFFEGGKDDRTQGTLKNVLRGRNQVGFVQENEMFAKSL